MQRPNAPSPLQRIIIALIGGLFLFGLALMLLGLGYGLRYSGRIFPGVRVGWVDLSGLTPLEATDQLRAAYEYPQRGQILLRDGENLWMATPQELGIFIDPAENAQAAFELGRTGSLPGRLGDRFQGWFQGVTLPLRMTFDQRIAHHQLTTIANQINVPTIEASLRVEAADVVVQRGQIGRRLDLTANITQIETLTRALIDGEINLVVDEDPPVIMDVEAQAQIARQILSAPLTLRMPGAGEDGPGPWGFAREDLGGMLVFERVPTPEGEEYQIGLDEARLRGFLEQIAPGLERRPENARFIFDDDTRQLEAIAHAAQGQSLDIEATILAVQSKVLAGEHDINLDMDYEAPQVNDEATAAELGITELVNSHTTYFYGSSASRKQNIRTAASRFHGLLVAPGETFSMARILGDVSLDTGYAEAWIIFGDRTIKGVGGGVCQVSTTLFRTVFFGGFPVVERYPHAYRVYYYEQTYGGGHDSDWAGLDATVYVPVVDFKFTNDTGYWLLMETYIGEYYLTWKFYSTSDGRTVDWSTTGLTNKQDAPEPRYEENEELGAGEIHQVDWAVEGAAVTVTRTVTRGGDVINEDVFTTNYIPWRAVCEYGPGTDGMPPENPDPDNPCRAD